MRKQEKGKCEEQDGVDFCADVQTETEGGRGGGGGGVEGGRLQSMKLLILIRSHAALAWTQRAQSGKTCSFRAYINTLIHSAAPNLPLTLTPPPPPPPPSTQPGKRKGRKRGRRLWNLEESSLLLAVHRAQAELPVTAGSEAVTGIHRDFTCRWTFAGARSQEVLR